MGRLTLTSEEQDATLLQECQVEKSVWVLEHQETLFALSKDHGYALPPRCWLAYREKVIIRIFVRPTVVDSIEVIIIGTI